MHRSSHHRFAGGILGPLIGVGTALVGGVVVPGYSHTQHTVSDLIPLSSTPAQALLFSLLFALFHGSVLWFGWQLHRASTTHWDRTWTFLLVALGSIGFLTVLLPTDPTTEAPHTLHGILHLTLVGIAAPTAAVAMVASAVSTPQRVYSFRWLTIALTVTFIVAGLATLWSISTTKTYLGLFERGALGAFSLWLVAASVRMTRRQGNWLRSVIPWSLFG